MAEDEQKLDNMASQKSGSIVLDRFLRYLVFVFAHVGGAGAPVPQNLTGQNVTAASRWEKHLLRHLRLSGWSLGSC